MRLHALGRNKRNTNNDTHIRKQLDQQEAGTSIHKQTIKASNSNKQSKQANRDTKQSKPAATQISKHINQTKKQSKQASKDTTQPKPPFERNRGVAALEFSRRAALRRRHALRPRPGLCGPGAGGVADSARSENWALTWCLGPPVVPFCRFFSWGRVPVSSNRPKKGYPYSNLSTGEPRCCGDGLDMFRVILIVSRGKVRKWG